jgi:hypothetical protein
LDKLEQDKVQEEHEALNDDDGVFGFHGVTKAHLTEYNFEYDALKALPQETRYEILEDLRVKIGAAEVKKMKEYFE